MNTLEAIKNLHENTELLKLPIDEQLEELKSKLLPKVVATTLSGNPILKIMVIEELAGALTALLKGNLCTGELVRSIASDEVELTDEAASGYAEGVNQQLNNIQIEANKIGAFLPQAEVLLKNENAIEIFIRVLTKNDAANLELNTFLDRTGISQWLRQSAIEFTMPEVKLAYLTTMMLAHMSNAQANQAANPSILLK